jgi:hypothetical protein
MSEEFDVLKIVVNRLEQAGIPYMITGSMAANFYVVPRMTRDIDIVLEIHNEDTRQIFESFKDDFYVDLSMIKDAVEHAGMFNIIHSSSVLKIDFILKKKSLYREVEFKNRRRVDFKGQMLWIVTLEDLILSKLFWAKDSFSELQLKDVKNLLRAPQEIDLGYIEKWVKTLELNEVYSKI